MEAQTPIIIQEDVRRRELGMVGGGSGTLEGEKAVGKVKVEITSVVAIALIFFSLVWVRMNQALRHPVRNARTLVRRRCPDLLTDPPFCFRFFLTHAKRLIL
jgi:hypothetical protein